MIEYTVVVMDQKISIQRASKIGESSFERTRA